MTYCFGFVHGESVYLVGDAAVTHSAAQSEWLASSFGEAPHLGASHSVAEGALKLVEIAPNCVVAMAGDSAKAFDGISVLRAAYDDAAEIPDLLDALLTSIDADQNREFSYLVARVRGNVPELWRWTSGSAVPAQRVQFSAQIGGLETWHTELTQLISQFFAGARLSEDRMLVTMVAVVQSYGLRDVLMSHGVGGLISGIRVSSAGVTWPPDTNYVIYDEQMRAMNVVSACYRDGVVATNSSYTNDTRFFFAALSSESIQQWMERWSEELSELFQSGAATIWAFLNSGFLAVFIVEATSNITETACFSVTQLSHGHYDIAIRSDLALALTAPVLDRPDLNAAPIRISYVAAANLETHLAGWIADRERRIRHE